MKYLPLNPAIFINNRKRFVKEMLPNSIAVFVSNDEWPGNGDALHSFKQNTDLFWLSGIQQEDSMVILFPDNPDPKYREVLVLVRPNELKEKWDGKRLRAKEAAAIRHNNHCLARYGRRAFAGTWVHLADHIYLDTNENDRKAPHVRSRDYRFVDEMRAAYPLHSFQRAAKIMKQLRAIKTKEEIEVVQKAIDITELLSAGCLQFIKPGVKEYEIEAEILSQLSSASAQPALLMEYHRQRR
jgi:Xaa-Pro aminopeptidase